MDKLTNSKSNTKMGRLSFIIILLGLVFATGLLLGITQVPSQSSYVPIVSSSSIDLTETPLFTPTGLNREAEAEILNRLDVAGISLDSTQTQAALRAALGNILLLEPQGAAPQNGTEALNNRLSAVTHMRWWPVHLENGIITLLMEGAYRQGQFNSWDNHIYENSSIRTGIHIDFNEHIFPAFPKFLDAIATPSEVYSHMNLASALQSGTRDVPMAAIADDLVWLAAQSQLEDGGAWGFNMMSRRFPHTPWVGGVASTVWLRCGLIHETHGNRLARSTQSHGTINGGRNAGGTEGIRVALHLNLNNLIEIEDSVVVSSVDDRRASVREVPSLNTPRQISSVIGSQEDSQGAIPPTDFNPEPTIIQFSGQGVANDPRGIAEITLFGRYGLNNAIGTRDQPVTINIEETQGEFVSIPIEGASTPDGAWLYIRAYKVNADFGLARAVNVEIALSGCPHEDSEDKFVFYLHATTTSSPDATLRHLSILHNDVQEMVPVFEPSIFEYDIEEYFFYSNNLIGVRFLTTIGAATVEVFINGDLSIPVWTSGFYGIYYLSA